MSHYLWPSTGGPEGEIAKLRLPYRIVLNEQKFVVIHAHVSQLQLENVTRVRALYPGNTDSPECKGKGEVPEHGGLRQKTCPRCNGRGWIKGLGGREKAPPILCLRIALAPAER